MSDLSGLSLLQDQGCLLASVEPAAGRPPLDRGALEAFIACSGYADWALSEEALDKIVSAYNEGVACQRLQLGESRDGSFRVDVDTGDMQVWIEMKPAFGGKAVDPDDVFLALGAAGVTFGIDPLAINSACAANVADRVLVASAIPAVDGEDARFELLVNDARDRSPQVNDKGLIDFRELGEIPTVAPDQPLMRRIPATPGKPGCNVRGLEIPAEAGYNAGFAERLIGSYADKEDPNLLRAVFSGQPVCSINGVNIEHVLRLRNVNMASGNIAFDGTVHVEGEVLPGMKVQASGDIIVGDVVDGGVLEAGGDIRVSGGIIAKASVVAAGSVTVRFVENAKVYAGTTILVEDTTLKADLQANNQIIVGLKNPNGRLSGGSARAMLLIRAPVLGAPTSGVTILQLGVNPVLETQYRDLLQQIEKSREEEDKLDKLVKHLAKQGDKTGMLERVNASRQAAIKAWGELLPQRDELERQLALIAEARVEVSVEVAGAVDMTFGKKVLHLRQPLEKGVFSVHGERVEFADATGKAVVFG